MTRYQTKSDWPPFLDQDERDCCKDEEIPEDQQSDDCVEIWKIKLKTATNALKIATAKADKATIAFGNSSAWEAKLKDWIETAKTAHGKAVVVYNQLNHFLHEVGRLETNTARTTTALEAVLCLVKRDIYTEIVTLLRTSTSVEDPERRAPGAETVHRVP